MLMLYDKGIYVLHVNKVMRLYKDFENFLYL